MLPYVICMPWQFLKKLTRKFEVEDNFLDDFHKCSMFSIS